MPAFRKYPQELRTAQLDLDRRASGEFGEHHRTEPESALAFEDEDLSLFEFERDGKTYEVTHEGGAPSPCAPATARSSRASVRPATSKTT